MKALVVAADVVTAYGRGLDTLWAALMAGRSAIRELDRFPTEHFVASRAATLDDLRPSDAESLVMQLIRPLVDRSRSEIPRDALLILATTAGEVEFLERDLFAGRNHGRESLPIRLYQKLASAWKLSAEEGLSISAACASSTVALAYASSLIQSSRRDAVLVAACDAVTEFVFAGFSSLMALDPDRARPFDRSRAGLTLGEAACYALVMSEDRAAREGRPILGEIAGWGLTGDANHMTGPLRDGGGVARAMKKAMRMADIDPAHAGAIIAHGTGTQYNDAMEMNAFKTVYGGRPVPTCSIKGGTGHTLGATGLVEALVGMRSLQEQRIPPSVGLRECDAEASGWVFDHPRPIATRSVISTNAGFGGVNAALVLRNASGTQPLSVTVRRAPRGIMVRGAAWVVPKSCGSLQRGVRFDCEDHKILGSRLRESGILTVPAKNSARFDSVSRNACTAVCLALFDAGMDPTCDGSPEVGLIGTNERGCLEANIQYFEDYLSCGRKMARGNLFIYTLPSSPFSEAAIYRRLRGPQFHLTSQTQGFRRAMDAAIAILEDQDADAMLVVHADPTEALAVCLSGSSGLPTPEAAGLLDAVRAIDVKDGVAAVVEQWNVLVPVSTSSGR